MKTRIRSGFQILLIIAVCIIVCSYSISAETQRPKNVQVALRAKWPGTSLLLEAGELLSKEWKDLFWEFIDAWLNNESGNTDPYTAKDCLQKIYNYGKSLVTGLLASVFELSLTLRSSSPRLVLYQQLAEESLLRFRYLMRLMVMGSVAGWTLVGHCSLMSLSCYCGFVILIRMEMDFSSRNCLTLIMYTLIHRKGVLLPFYMELLGQTALRIFIERESYCHFIWRSWVSGFYVLFWGDCLI